MDAALVKKFLDTCHLIQARGMTSGSGGNISVRSDDGFLITPSGRSLESLTENDIVLLQKDGSYTCKNEGIPSKEWRMHLACYERSDVNAVVHVHSSYAVAVASLKGVNKECAIPVYTPGYGMRVGKIPVLPYFTPGSIDLYKAVAKTIEKRNSSLLANHGSIAVGKNLETALNIAEEIEEEAKLFIILGDNGKALSEEEQDHLAPHGMKA